MPAEAIHLTALREAIFEPAIPAAARRCALRFEAVARLGAVGPDLPYFDRYAEAVVRHTARLPPRSSAWGARVHDGGAISILGVVIEHAQRERSEILAALAMGFASHACIDRSIHPLVNALARRFPEASTQDGAHREVEKFQSILFHERYWGVDGLGSPAITRLVAVPARELLADARVGPTLAAAFACVADEPRTEVPLRRMVRGYENHAWLLGSPLGKRIAPPAEKERARPLFLEGPWGTFERVLAEAIALSLPVIEAVWGACTASDGHATTARSAVAALLPPGTIEGQGLDVDLERPYLVRPPSTIAA